MGRSRFLVFYLLTGLIAGITHHYTKRHAPPKREGS